jgi:hypothetical protein
VSRRERRRSRRAGLESTRQRRQLPAGGQILTSYQGQRRPEHQLPADSSKMVLSVIPIDVAALGMEQADASGGLGFAVGVAGVILFAGAALACARASARNGCWSAESVMAIIHCGVR